MKVSATFFKNVDMATIVVHIEWNSHKNKCF